MSETVHKCRVNNMWSLWIHVALLQWGVALAASERIDRFGTWWYFKVALFWPYFVGERIVVTLWP